MAANETSQTKKKRPSKYKYCFVPSCTSTTICTPNKHFVPVPLKPEIRKKWFEIARREVILKNNKTSFYCCSDHFNRNDYSNWTRHQLTGYRLKINPHVLPSIFNCQIDRKRAHQLIPKASIIKREHQKIVENALQGPSTSSLVEEPQEVDVPVLVSDVEQNTTEGELAFNKSTQVNIHPHYRSHGIQAAVDTISRGCSPMRNKNQKLEGQCSLSSPGSSETDFSIDSDELDSSYEENLPAKCSSMINFIELKPKCYIGVPKPQFHIIKLIATKTKLPLHKIYIVLKKIKLNESFEIIADQFGYTKSNISKIFCSSLPLIAHCFSQLVFANPVYNKIALPIAFRNNYFKVNSIIDCFEIEIEKPSCPIKQALTWSEYKKCNTIKYLVSCTPNGCITYVSEGYGGRTSDKRIIETSGFLEHLPPNSYVMTDRGFKHVEPLLMKRNHTLVRPPTVETNKKLSKEEVIKGKSIASLRIHVERLIRRFREYKLVSPHACVDHYLIRYLDYVVTTCAGVINIQPPLLKK